MLCARLHGFPVEEAEAAKNQRASPGPAAGGAAEWSEATFQVF